MREDKFTAWLQENKEALTQLTMPEALHEAWKAGWDKAFDKGHETGRLAENPQAGFE